MQLNSKKEDLNLLCKLLKMLRSQPILQIKRKICLIRERPRTKLTKKNSIQPMLILFSSLLFVQESWFNGRERVLTTLMVTLDLVK